METANEICAATAILAAKGVVELEYEPALLNTKKSFDFRVTLLFGKKAPVKLLFCSNGPLRRDAVEDFAHFYRTGMFHEGDWGRNELSRYLKEKGIVYDQTLDGFSYLYLRWETGDSEQFVVREERVIGYL